MIDLRGRRIDSSSPLTLPITDVGKCGRPGPSPMGGPPRRTLPISLCLGLVTGHWSLPTRHWSLVTALAAYHAGVWPLTRPIFASSDIARGAVILNPCAGAVREPPPRSEGAPPRTATVTLRNAGRGSVARTFFAGPRLVPDGQGKAEDQQNTLRLLPGRVHGQECLCHR
jgi:hypothetical protein